MENKQEIRRAFTISAICIFTYLMSYHLRNLLSVFTPGMLDSGLFTEESVALLSSVYMIVYASGQLVNGVLGDMIRSKVMVLIGLVFAGTGTVAFSLTDLYPVRVVCFALLGFGLSMLRGPLVKVISENTKPAYARVACVFLSFVSFAGPFLAGLLAMALPWDRAFLASGCAAFGMAAFSFLVLSLLEHRGAIKTVKRTPDPGTPDEAPKKKGSILDVFRLESFIPYLFVSMVIEIAGTTISFWIPTYISENLGFDPASAALIFSAMSFIRALCPFVSLFLFRLFRENDARLMRVFLCASAAFYVAMFFVRDPIANIVVFLLALVCSSVSSSTLWSIYIPSLGKSGKVSSANGIMDASGYAAAALANLVFARLMTDYGWGTVILAWGGVMAAGAVFTVFASIGKARRRNGENA